ncbi:CrcB family protein [Homoserinimonas sp. OAct 916]|uniref:fluoride efflux transporter FluC n=1 Tax=Homoserinimonas sp. OAct 916 TaxID=2211450 RepID=UPI000DBE947E|nr:CrcB family protein [Homoserinimonas sp. OAct 916]
MTPLLFIAAAVAGGIGVGCRFFIDGVLRGLRVHTFPLETGVINITGSLLLGFLTGIALVGTLPDEWLFVIGTGFLGGFTTFSTATFETVRLFQEERAAAALVHGLGMMVLAILAAGLGFWFAISL